MREAPRSDAGPASSDEHVEPLAPRFRWDPRRSITARLTLVLLAVVLVPAVAFEIASDRTARVGEREMNALLVDEATERERTRIRQDADHRAAQLDEKGEEIRRVLHEAVPAVARALREASSGEGAETLLDVPGQPLRTAGHGESAAFVSRASSPPERVRRDLAATRSLERTFSALIAGHASISAVYVGTPSGVLRVVPWRDLQELLGSYPADFHVPGPWPSKVWAKGAREETVAWTGLYEDLYARRGRIATGMVPVPDAHGAFLAEIGVDWALEEIMLRWRVASDKDAELLLAADGSILIDIPERRARPEEARQLALIATQGRSSLPNERVLFGQSVIVASRKLKSFPWTYVRTLPLAVVKRQVASLSDPILESAQDRRRTMHALYLIVMVSLAGLLVLASRTVTAPIRRTAQFAGAIARGDPAPELPSELRHDEIGILARAMRKLDTRVRRRIESMAGAHELSRMASVTTRRDEMYARLTRRIAELVNSAKCWFCVFDPESRALVLTPPGHGVSDEVLAGLQVPLSEPSLAVLSYKTGEPTVSNDVRHDVRAAAALVRRFAVENVLFVPLRTEVGTLGVLVVADKAGGFDEEDIAAVQSYADQAALLLRNARLYEELQRSYEQLRDAHRHRDYFLQNINHELRTPLTAILGWSEILAEDRPGPEAASTAIEQIRRSAEFLLTLISDLLDLSRLEEGGVKLERAPTDVGKLVRDAIEPVAVMAESKGIAVTLATPDGAADVRLDALRMRQVLWNLVHNAVKFTPKGGHIRVAVEVDGTGALFTVSDDGVGVDPKDLPFIFERFRQGDGSTTRAYRGTGIGLSLAKRFVELHGGAIEVESAPGRGARFRVRIPSLSSSGSVARLSG